MINNTEGNDMEIRNEYYFGKVDSKKKSPNVPTKLTSFDNIDNEDSILKSPMVRHSKAKKTLLSMGYRNSMIGDSSTRKLGNLSSRI